ncbi:MAG: tyrosine-type recombinase/integrase [Nitrososphaerales archaeon]|jgi:integrase
MKDCSRAHLERELARLMAELGPYRSVDRFISKYGKPTTKVTYLNQLVLYVRWLRTSKRVSISLDELVTDNLRCVYESKATDVETKRRHTDWLDGYVNRCLVDRGVSYSTRKMTSTAVREFYKRNDSTLFGDFSVSEPQTDQRPPKPLEAGDIRATLSALPPQQRLPLLMVWQSGTEIGKVLSLTWRDLEGLDSGEHLVKLSFQGRKLHRKPYYTFIGRDSVGLLKMWRGRWAEQGGREPTPEDFVMLGKSGMTMDRAHLNGVLQQMATRLFRQGMVKNGDPGSWHTHYLRHSFETEASHAGVKAELRDFFAGHMKGIQWIYNHRDELHEEDLVKEYRKVEPYVSLNQTEAVLKGEFEEERRSWITEIQELKRQVARLAGSSLQDAQAAQAP